MSEIKRSRNIIEILNEIEEKANDDTKNKIKPNSKEFLFFPLMDIKNKFKICNNFDKKNSQKFLEEKDEYLQRVELDDRLPDEIKKSLAYKIIKTDPLNITFGK